MNLRRWAFLVLVASLAAVLASPAHADVRASVNVSFFYDSLAPHGQWISSAQFGYVWRPLRVYAGWRPYSDGYWVYTDFGWTFVSDDPWGWATYHYGRWYFDPFYGWVWVPGYEWAPAWVVFHQGGGYVGWAPLPPNVSLSLAIGGGYRFDPRAYCFVEERHFVDRRMPRYLVAPERNVALVRSTVNVTHFARAGDRYVNRSLSTARIERSARQRIERRPIVDLSDHRRAGLRVESDRVAAFRPQVSRQAAHPPREVVRRGDSRGGRIDRERPARRESPARIERRAEAPRSPARVGGARQERGERPRVESRPAASRERAQARPAQRSARRQVTQQPKAQREARRTPDNRRPPHGSGGGG